MATVAALVIGGGGPGGGGGGNFISGGGAGGYKYNAAITVSLNVAYNITVGTGGVPNPGSNGTNGNNSSFDAFLTAYGGGFGGVSSAQQTGNTGNGTGAGSGGNATLGGQTPSTAGAGAGGGGCGIGSGTVGSGGGGGSSGNGGDAVGGTSGASGAGTSNSISGSAVTYCQGGSNSGSSQTLTPGSGSGYIIQNGADGIVIISVVTANFGTNTYTGACAKTTNGANTVYTFTGAGTITFVPGVTTQTVTVTTKARILTAGVTKTSSAKARVKQAGVTKTIQTKARVLKAGVTKTATAKSRIKSLGNDKTVQAKAYINPDDSPDGIRAGWLNINWISRFKITPTSVNPDLYFDLSLAPSYFWDAVRSDGGDIRVTSEDGVTRVPREVSGFDYAGHKGSLFIGTNSGTAFYVYFGNASATEPAANATYGKQNVWGSNYGYVGHLDIDGRDSSPAANNGTDLNTSIVASPLGNAERYAGGFTSPSRTTILDNAALKPTDKFALFIILKNNKSSLVGRIYDASTLGFTGFGTIVNVSGNNYIKSSAGGGTGTLFSYRIPNTEGGSRSIRARGYASNANLANKGYVRVVDAVTGEVLVTNNGFSGSGVPTTPTTNGQLEFCVFNVNANDYIVTVVITSDTYDIWLNNIQIEMGGRDGYYSKDGFCLCSDGGTDVRMQTNIGGSSSVVTSGVNFQVNTWYRIWAMWNGTNRNIYINNISKGTDAISGTMAAGTGNAVIGENAAFSSARALADVAEVRWLHIPPDVTYRNTLEANLSNPAAFWTVTSEFTKTAQVKSRIMRLGLTKTITVKALILRNTSQTVGVKADIQKLGNDKTTQAKARVKQANITNAIQTKSRIQVLGATKMFQTKARIRVAGVTLTASALSRIKVTITRTFSAKARIKALETGIIVGTHGAYGTADGVKGGETIPVGTHGVYGAADGVSLNKPI